MNTAQPLRNLLAAHRAQPPLAVITGANNADTQIHTLRTWRALAEAAGVDGVTLDARLTPAASAETRDLIHHTLRSPLTDREWRLIWLTCMARAAGIDAAPGDTEQKLATAPPRTIFLVDGLDDLLPQIAEDDAQQQALRVLLTDCLDWLRGLPGRPHGLIIFARHDLVRAAIKQNHAQFLARYADYELNGSNQCPASSSTPTGSASASSRPGGTSTGSKPPSSTTR